MLLGILEGFYIEIQYMSAFKPGFPNLNLISKI